jgi:S1-C subfamily serine protease
VVFDARRGLIITNSHVIDHANEITVKLTDGRALPARRVGADSETEVAVIQVRADVLTELPFGNTDRLEVGDFVFAIGNPQKIGQTVTAGIVSGLHRANVGLGAYEDFIHTDAAIYPGNSGGALVDLRGDLVGINTAFIAVGKDNPGMSFAIPINMARSLVDQMLEFGDIRRGLGAAAVTVAESYVAWGCFAKNNSTFSPGALVSRTGVVQPFDRVCIELKACGANDFVELRQ